MEDVRLAEQALVAVLALEPARVGEVSGWLSPSDFGMPAAGLLFARLLEIDASGRHEPAALLEVLRARGELRRDGYPMSALVGWWDDAPVSGHVGAYGRLVVEGQVARQLGAAGVRLVQAASSGGPARALSMVMVQRALLAAASRRLASVPAPPADVPPRTQLPPVAAAQVSKPAAAELEQAELVTAGSVLLSPAAARVSRWLAPSDFASAEVGDVFGAAVTMRVGGRPVDRVTVTAELRARGSFVGADVVARCEAAVPVTASVGFYARRVLAASVQRQVTATGLTLTELGEHRPGGSAAAVEAALAALDRMTPLSCRLRMALATTTSPATAAAERAVTRPVAFEPARW